MVANEPIRKPAPVTENKIIFDLDSTSELFTPSFEEEVEAAAAVQEVSEASQTKINERRERLRRLSLDANTDAAIKEKLEVPAYLRRNVQLENVVPSAEQQISRFNLNDDNELLGDNRFLHDNVD